MTEKVLKLLITLGIIYGVITLLGLITILRNPMQLKPLENTTLLELTLNGEIAKEYAFYMGIREFYTSNIIFITDEAARGLEINPAIVHRYAAVDEIASLDTIPEYDESMFLTAYQLSEGRTVRFFLRHDYGIYVFVDDSSIIIVGQ